MKKYLIPFVAICGLTVISCSDETLNNDAEVQRLQEIEKDEYEIPTNGMDFQKIEKDEYYIPPGG